MITPVIKLEQPYLRPPPDDPVVITLISGQGAILACALATTANIVSFVNSSKINGQSVVQAFPFATPGSVISGKAWDVREI